MELIWFRSEKDSQKEHCLDRDLKAEESQLDKVEENTERISGREKCICGKKETVSLGT